MRRALVVVLILAPVLAAGLLLWASGGAGPTGVPGSAPQAAGESGLLSTGEVSFLGSSPGRGKPVPEGGLRPHGSGSPQQGEGAATGDVQAWVEGFLSGTDLEVGLTAPDFALPGLDGAMLRLSDWRGEKAVIVNFWATWCPPCREEMPHFERLRQERGHEVEIVAVNVYEPPEKVAEFYQELGLTFPAALDRNGEVSSRYLVRPMPTSFFIDRAGVIRARYFGAMSYSVMEGLLDLTLSAEREAG